MLDTKILKLPEAALRTKATKVEKITSAEISALSSMADSMYLNQGVGLAAVQIGIGKQLAVIDVGEGLIKMVNPVIVRRDGIETQEEGCLSCPGVSVKVKRAKIIVVQYLNENGDLMELKASGLLARAVQHELDHLKGKLIVDYLSPIKRLFNRKLLSSRSRKSSSPK